MNSHKAPKGFTLIELLVVIAIIGLLSTIAVVALNSARSKGRDAKRVADVRQIQTALELFLNDRGAYPIGGPIALGVTPNRALCKTSEFEDVGCPGGDTTYMGVIPRDPGKGSSDAADVCPVGAGDSPPCDYAYTRTAAERYEIQLNLEGAIGGLVVGNNCATEVGMAPTCRH